MTIEPVASPFYSIGLVQPPMDSVDNDDLVSGQWTDRLRIALGVNDTVIRHLFSISLALHAARAMVATDAQIRLDSCINELDAAIGELRALIFDLETGTTA